MYYGLLRRLREKGPRAGAGSGGGGGGKRGAVAPLSKSRNKAEKSFKLGRLKHLSDTPYTPTAALEFQTLEPLDGFSHSSWSH